MPGNPDVISKKVLEKLDRSPAYKILSVDIADVDSDENIQSGTSMRETINRKKPEENS